MPANAVSRFPYGNTNNGPDDIFAAFIQNDPTKLHMYWNDFDVYTAGDWVVTETDSNATEALTAGDGGLLLITNTAADNDLVLLQKTPAAFAMTAGKQAWFKARFKVSDATESDLQFGLVIVDTTPLDATDGIYFQKDDGDAQLDIICRKNATTGSTSATNIATVVSDTYLTVAWYYDGFGLVQYAVDGTIKGALTASSAYLPDATNLTVSMALQNGEAVAKTMTVDYIFAAVER